MFHLPNPYRWHQSRRERSPWQDLAEAVASLLGFTAMLAASWWLLGFGFITLGVFAFVGNCWVNFLCDFLPNWPDDLRSWRANRLSARALQEPATSVAPPSVSRRRMPPPRVRR
jgi:hypothetical protein